MLEMSLNPVSGGPPRVKGDVAGANWMFVLPRLDLKRTVCLGWPRPPALRTIAQFSEQVLIASRLRPRGKKTSGLDCNLPNVVSVPVVRYRNLIIAGATVDLVCFADRNAVREFAADRVWRQTVLDWLKPGGMIYLQQRQVVSSHRRPLAPWEKAGGSAQSLWLAPAWGEVKLAAPCADGEAIRFCRNHCQGNLSSVRAWMALRRGPVENPLTAENATAATTWLPHSPKRLRQLGREMLRQATNRMVQVLERFESAVAIRLSGAKRCLRRGLLWSADAEMCLGAPPKYLQAVAARHGISIGRHRWCLAATGEYASRKVLFYLFHPSVDRPEYIVKMVREGRFNARLAREASALAALAGLPHRDFQRLPKVAFRGEHGGLQIVGETYVPGVPFDQRTTFRHDCPLAHATTEWLTQLGAATCHAGTASGREMAKGLTQLLHRFEHLYGHDPQRHGFLTDQISRVAHCPAPIPLVFQHGDPGRWNLLACGPRQTVFLDWEAAEPDGIPLWDMFYFLRSYCVGSARKHGVRHRLVALDQQFFGRGALTDMIAQAITRYCRLIRVPRALVEPLFYMCWLHRSLKEATRLPQRELDGGHYYRWLNHCVQKGRSQTGILDHLLSDTPSHGSLTTTT